MNKDTGTTPSESPGPWGSICFAGQLLSNVPAHYFSAGNRLMGIVGVFGITALAFNQPLGQHLLSWDGFSPWWGLAGLGVFIAFGMLESVHVRLVKTEADLKRLQNREHVDHLVAELHNLTEDCQALYSWVEGYFSCNLPPRAPDALKAMADVKSYCDRLSELKAASRWPTRRTITSADLTEDYLGNQHRRALTALAESAREFIGLLTNQDRPS